MNLAVHQEIFAKNLQTLIDTHGLTAKSLAKELGVVDMNIYRYLQGARVPKIDNLILLSEYFGVSLDWLIGLSKNPTNALPDDLQKLVTAYNLAPENVREVVWTVLEKYK